MIFHDFVFCGVNNCCGNSQINLQLNLRKPPQMVIVKNRLCKGTPSAFSAQKTGMDKAWTRLK
jgi:hypothetical protein